MASIFTPEGYKKFGDESTTGPVGQARAFVDSIYTADAIIEFNKKKMNVKEYAAFLDEVRAGTTSSDSTVHEFVFDGDTLAARVTGISKVNGHDLAFESWLFGKVDKEAGKFKSVHNRTMSGPVGKDLS